MNLAGLLDKLRGGRWMIEPAAYASLLESIGLHCASPAGPARKTEENIMPVFTARAAKPRPAASNAAPLARPAPAASIAPVARLSAYACTCPQCGYDWVLRQGDADKADVACPSCKHRWQPAANEVKTVRIEPYPDGGAPGKEARAFLFANTYRATCPACKQPHKLHESDLSGRGILCSACGHRWHPAGGEIQKQDKAATALDLQLASMEDSANLRRLELTAHATLRQNLDSAAADEAFSAGAQSQQQRRMEAAAPVNKNYVTLGQKILIARPDAPPADAKPTPQRWEYRADYERRVREWEARRAAAPVKQAEAFDPREDPVAFCENWQKAMGTYTPPQTAFAALANRACAAEVEKCKSHSGTFHFDASALVAKRRELEAAEHAKTLGLPPGMGLPPGILPA